MATHTEDQDGAQAPTSKAQRKRARRSAARLSAVQALYQMDIAKTDLNQVIHEFTHIRTDKADAKRRAAEREAAGAGAAPDDTQPTPARQAVPAGARDADADPDALSTVIGTADHTYFAEILRGVVRLQRTIDPEVDKQLATGWRLARVDSILRQTLRAAAFELIERQEVPARAVISEYIDVAKAFFDGDQPGVVNGVLDKLARRFRPDEFARTMAKDSDRSADGAPSTSEATPSDGDVAVEVTDTVAPASDDPAKALKGADDASADAGMPSDVTKGADP